MTRFPLLRAALKFVLAWEWLLDCSTTGFARGACMVGVGHHSNCVGCALLPMWGIKSHLSHVSEAGHLSWNHISGLGFSMLVWNKGFAFISKLF